MTKQIVAVGIGGALLVGLVLTWRAAQPSGVGGEAPASAAALSVEPSTAPSLEPGLREEVALESAPIEEPESAPLVSPEDELRTALEWLSPAIDRSLDGRIDPGAILDAAFLVAARELGPPELEPDFAGRLVIPVEGMPEGVRAALCIDKPNRSQQKVLTLEIEFERHVPLVHEHFEREGARVWLATWTGESDELQHFSIGTDVAAGRRSAGYSLAEDPPEIRSGVSVYTNMADPGAWKLKASGMREVEGSLDADGGRSYKSGSWELPPVLEGGPWPRIDDMRRFNHRLHELHAAAKERGKR
jgi:hypothetical protein